MLLGTDASQSYQHETAVAQFLLTFTEAADGASLSKGKLADQLSRWHQNLTGNSVSPPSIGRSLRALDVETTDQAISDRRWIYGELME